jgi:hypothetical protein
MLPVFSQSRGGRRPLVAAGPKSYRYVKWLITQIKSDEGLVNQVICQYSEFVLRLSGSAISYSGIPNPTTASDADNVTNGNPNSHHGGGETPLQGIDVNTATKFCLQTCGIPNGVGGRNCYCSLILDAGSGHTFIFDSYTFSTANDSQQRDPSTWTLYGSHDGSTWTALDSQTNIVCTSTRTVATGLIFSIP